MSLYSAYLEVSRVSYYNFKGGEVSLVQIPYTIVVLPLLVIPTNITNVLDRMGIRAADKLGK